MKENSILINDRFYDDYDTRVSWGNFYVNSYTPQGKVTCEGISPIIKFNINDNILIRIETTYSKELFQNSKINHNEDISKYITDISYEDEQGWMSIITGKYACNMIRRDKNKFQFILNVKSNELEEIKININAIIELDII